jgi:hypothetical protein
MPTLPAPLPFIPGAGDLPVKSADDIRPEFPAPLRGPAEAAPVREVIVEGERALMLEHQERAGYAAAQADPTRATGVYLDGHAEDRGTFRQPEELDEPLRARMLATPQIVTPTAIVSAVNAILAPYTTKLAQYHESILDRWFVNDGDPGSAWHSFVGAGPHYPDRLYDDHQGTPGRRSQSDPGGAWVFPDSNGRMFVLRVPVIAGLEAGHAFVLDGSVNETVPGAVTGSFLGDGTDALGSESSGLVGMFITDGYASEVAVYQAVANSVEAIVGQGVRWQLVADPAL